MVEETNERVKRYSEGVFTSGSRAKASRESGEISSPPSPRDDLLIAVIILGIIVFALILIIIYGYCKYVRRGGGDDDVTEGRNRSKNMREPSEVPEQPSPNRSTEQLEVLQQSSSVPVKTRKRSMTFSETDEECRKYREGLADSYNNDVDNNSNSNNNNSPEVERSRKKSVVTFVGVKEIDGNES